MQEKSEKKPKLLVVDDSMDNLMVLRHVISEYMPECEIVTTNNAAEGLSLASEEYFDCALVDVQMPKIDGIEMCRRLKINEYSKNIPVALLTSHGVDSLTKVTAVKKVANREVFVTPSIMEKMVTRIGQPTKDVPELALSDRELQVLLLLARSSTSREVSKILGISFSTVETYRRRILEKLNLKNNSDITRFAIRRGLIDIE